MEACKTGRPLLYVLSGSLFLILNVVEDKCVRVLFSHCEEKTSIPLLSYPFERSFAFDELRVR